MHNRLAKLVQLFALVAPRASLGDTPVWYPKKTNSEIAVPGGCVSVSTLGAAEAHVRAHRPGARMREVLTLRGTDSFHFMEKGDVVSRGSMLLAVLCLTGFTAFAQSTAAPPTRPASGSIGMPKPPLFFREDWTGNPAPRGCFNLHDAKCEPALTQAHVGNKSLELLLYGAGKQRVEDGLVYGAVLIQGSNLFTGMAEQPYAVALRDKNNYVDLSGLGKIRWTVRASGLHVVHPIVKLADGTWLLGEHADGGNQFEPHTFEHNVSEQRWIKLDIDKVVTLGPRVPEPVDVNKARQLEQEFAASRGVWRDSSQVDLTKVDAVGFADLMPGSGHGYGGYIGMGAIEVYGKPVPR